MSAWPVVELAPERVEGHIELGRIRTSDWDWQGAEAALTRALQLAPENAGYWDTLAEARFASGNYVEAATLETRALSLKPHDPFMMRQVARFKRGSQR